MSSIPGKRMKDLCIFWEAGQCNLRCQDKVMGGHDQCLPWWANANRDLQEVQQDNMKHYSGWAPEWDYRISPQATSIRSCCVDIENRKPRLPSQWGDCSQSSSLICRWSPWVSFTALLLLLKFGVEAGSRAPLWCTVPPLPLCSPKGHLAVPDERSLHSPGNWQSNVIISQHSPGQISLMCRVTGSVGSSRRDPVLFLWKVFCFLLLEIDILSCNIPWLWFFSFCSSMFLSTSPHNQIYPHFVPH